MFLFQTLYIDKTNVDVVYLNDINFVDDLIFATNNNEFLNITGKKTFHNGLCK